MATQNPWGNDEEFKAFLRQQKRKQLFVLALIAAFVIVDIIIFKFIL